MKGYIVAIVKYFADLPARLAEFGRDRFDSYLEVPDGRNPELNASLTITLRVHLNFADSTNVVPGVIARDRNGWFARDTDGRVHNVCNWDAPSRHAFQERFLATQKIWDDRFVLITPKNYDGLDYGSMIGQGWHIRPNVVCFFRVYVDPTNYHHTIHVVRLEPTFLEDVGAAPATPRFRGSSSLYASNSSARALGEEIGHALHQPHVRGHFGLSQCRLGAACENDERSEGENDSRLGNIMGSGTALTEANAVSWTERVAQHTGTDADAWEARMEATRPRKVPLGVFEVGRLTRY